MSLRFTIATPKYGGSVPPVKPRSLTELQAGLDHVRASPFDRGRIELIVRRPAENEREVLHEATLDTIDGLVGDTWKLRPSSLTGNRGPHPDLQLTLMNARVTALIAQTPDRWQLAGDQLYVDFDLSIRNLPPGTQLAIGPSALIEITDKPHTGCSKFTKRFGVDAMKFVNSTVGRELHMRGVNAKVIAAGVVTVGDLVAKA